MYFGISWSTCAACMHRHSKRYLISDRKTAEQQPLTTAKEGASMTNSKICIATLLLPLAGALQQMRLATSSTMAPHWQPKPAPAPLVDAPAAPALSVEAAMRIMFDPVGRGKVRHGAYIKLSWRVAIDATSGVLVAPDSTIDSRTGAAARRQAAGLDGPHGGITRGLCAGHRARGAERPLGARRAAVGDARLLARVPPRRREPVHIKTSRCLARWRGGLTGLVAHRRKARPRRARRGHPREGIICLRPHADDAQRAVARVLRRRSAAGGALPHLFPRDELRAGDV